ncbi:ABC transporter ATP-binding protein [Alteromonadaceae bacterium M269]|nr:ABC transporter ATP-binding protein [Alteromonadaceae bacterium M269]
MIEIEKLSIAYDKNVAVKEASFTLAKGEVACLLGPSGCGKSSILRAIAGLESIESGKVILRDDVVSSTTSILPTEKRRIAMMFQDFALFPHLNVEQNIKFGLFKQSKDVQQKRSEELLQLVGLEGLGSRQIHELSGGQQQRVALARALAADVDILLLDEPFSSLDTSLREELAADIRRIVKQQQITAILVTHDQHEAFAFADVIGVIRQGEIQQWGTAFELYHTPVNLWVANFVGEGALIKGLADERGIVETALGCFPSNLENSSASEVNVLIRPDDIVHDDSSRLTAKVVEQAFRGSHIMFTLELDSEQRDTVLCLAPSHHNHEVGEYIGIRLDVQHVVAFA